ncbi:MAG: hypothetical protein NTZ55_05635 [Candidatus Roizmanbacteria bacterium]|nr:hypothetical protein [Candidatus Roizmanbacteria bacterium]
MLQLEPRHTLAHSFCVMPDIRFENQKADEEVILTLRSHPLTLIPVFFNSLVFFTLIFFSNFLIVQFLNPLQVTYINIFFLFFSFVYLWIQIVNWYFNIGIITNKQVIDVDFNALVFRNVTRTNLSHIEDVSVKSSGFISSIFNYGNIFIQTAGSEINSEFFQVPQPEEASHIIQNILKEYGTNK